MTSPSISDAVLWRTASRFHDWRSHDRSRALLQHWLDSAIIGAPTWVESHDTVVPYTAPEKNLPEALLATRPADEDGTISFRTGGDAPHQWWLSMLLPPYDEETKRNAGYVMINLLVPRAAFASREKSIRLLNAFDAFHRPDNSEFAAIHPDRHMEELKLRHYIPALTFGPMFAGVFWANFLGPGHIERFPRECLDGLDVFRRRWFDSTGVFFAVSDDLQGADGADSEGRLITLTKDLRDCMTSRSPGPKRP
jgi:hypothetical protein